VESPESDSQPGPYSSIDLATQLDTEPPEKPLNLLGLTQSSNLELFLNLLSLLREDGMKLGKVGSLASYYRAFKRSQIVQEVGAAARKESADFELLGRLEEELDPGALWDSIIGDRRLIYGRASKVIEDYRVHFTDDQLWAILSRFAKDFEALLAEIEPDVMLGFTPVTFGEILALKIAKARGIPSLQLHSSRIRNYVGLHDQSIGTSRHFLKLVRHPENLTDESLSVADTVIQEIRDRGAIYEGVNLSIRKGRAFDPVKSLKTLPKVVGGAVVRHRNPIARRDHHDPGYLTHWWMTAVRQPVRALRVDHFMQSTGREIPVEELADLGRYCFFPLHSEPEVALQVLGRPYHKNQIELLRNLGCSLPPGMKLVVKEHPRSFGLRPVEFYETLLQIPNLVFVDMRASAIDIVRHASLVTVISSTIGIEALALGKPVLAVGHPKYGGVFESLLVRCYDLFALPEAVRRALRQDRGQGEVLRQGIAALVQGSVPIDLYSVLLQKPDRYAAGRDHLTLEERRAEDFQRLAGYVRRRIAEVLEDRPNAPEQPVLAEVGETS